MKSRQQCKQKYSSFDDDDNDEDDEYYVRLQKQFEQLNLDHLRVLDDGSDEDDECAQFSPLRSSQRSRLRKQPGNPILLSAQFRDASADLDEAHGQNGLTYVDCLLFEEERRKRRNARQQRQEEKEEWPKRRQIRVCRVEQPAPPVPLPPASKHGRPLYDDCVPSECEKKSPDSAFGSEDGSSNDPRVECEEAHRSDVRMTTWRLIKEQSAATTQPLPQPRRGRMPANHRSPLLRSIDFQQLAAQRRREHLNNACLYPVLTSRPTEYDIPTPACSSNGEDDDDPESGEHCDM